jgi:hypothetical protein
MIGGMVVLTVIHTIHYEKHVNPPAPKENKGEAKKPKSAEQGGTQKQLHRPHARDHEDKNRACHEEPPKGGMNSRRTSPRNRRKGADVDRRTHSFIRA